MELETFFFFFFSQKYGNFNRMNISVLQTAIDIGRPRADLHVKIFVTCDKLTAGLRHTTYDCRSVLKHVLKCYDIFLMYTPIVSHDLGLS